MEIANFGWFWGSKKIKSSWWLRNSCLYPSWDACGFHLVGNVLETPRKHVASLVSFFNVTHYGVHESSESMWRSAWVSANVRLWFIALFCECSVEHDWIGITPNSQMERSSQGHFDGAKQSCFILFLHFSDQTRYAPELFDSFWDIFGIYICATRACSARCRGSSLHCQIHRILVASRDPVGPSRTQRWNRAVQ